MNRRTYFAKKKAKRLSPYRRLEAQLANAREALSHAVDEYMKMLRGLESALGFIDRLMPQSKNAGEGWNAADVQRLAEIRKLCES